MRNIVFVILTMFIFLGCSDTTPLPITADNSKYIGVWQKRIEDETDRFMKVDNMLLAINQDASAVYRKCEYNETKSENFSRSTSSSANLPSAVVTNISNETITVAQKFGWFGFGLDLDVNKAPYQVDGIWYMNIEDKKLKKLSDLAVQVSTNWTCPSDEDGF